MRSLPLSVILLVVPATGCITGRVVQASTRLGRSSAERLTTTATAVGPDGAVYGVAALEAECRITPGDPDAGLGARSYSLERSAAPDPESRQLAKEHGATLVASYRPRSDEPPAPSGGPRAVLVVERDGGHGSLLLSMDGRWKELPARRYLHRTRSSGHPALAAVTEATLVPVSVAADIATFPIQWLLAPWLPLTPP